MSCTILYKEFHRYNNLLFYHLFKKVCNNITCSRFGLKEKQMCEHKGFKITRATRIRQISIRKRKKKRKKKKKHSFFYKSRCIYKLSEQVNVPVIIILKIHFCHDIHKGAPFSQNHGKKHSSPQKALQVHLEQTFSSFIYIYGYVK